MPCTEQDFQKMPLDFVRGSQAIMWNNGSLYNISKAAKYVDDSVCAVVPKGSTWARNPIPRIHTDNIGVSDLRLFFPFATHPFLLPREAPSCARFGA